MGIMPKPTSAALSRTPKAVIMLAVPANDLSQVSDYDYEPFEPEDDVDGFVNEVTVLAEEDVVKNGDLVHVIVDLSDTKPLTIGRVEIRGRDLPDGWADQREAEIRANPVLVVAPGPKRAPAAPKATTKAAPKAQVKGRKQSAAAAVVNGGGKAETTEDATPVPRAAAVKAKKAQPKAEAEVEPTTQAAPKGAEARKAALKKRLKANTEDAGMGLLVMFVR